MLPTSQLPALQLIFMGEVEGGKGTEEGETEVAYDQLVLRYVLSPRAVFDVGKFPGPVGAFANRRLSTTNPLIGVPDGYAVNYPWGVAVSGATSRLDYRAAIISVPPTHPDYVPDPSPAVHPDLGVGFTPGPEWRLGASAVWGPYLNPDVAPDLPAGTEWQDYTEWIVAFDTRVSRGYFEFRGELALSRYDVPTQSAPLHGVTYYAEVKQTWAPRVFTAVRVERNDYGFIRPRSGSPWISQPVDAYDAEVGLGVRANAGTIIKASYRRSWWHGSSLRDGYALALQVSYHVDVMDLLERKR